MKALFFQRWFLLALVMVNAAGTVWGIVWYWEQLVTTPWYFLPFVPDSPGHAALFAVYIWWLATGRVERLVPWQCFLAWAGVLGVIKYGLWMTLVISQFLLAQGSKPGIEDWMLYFSHGGMAVQGLVYMGRLPRLAMPTALSVLWLVANDFFDYILFTHPRLPLSDQFAVAAITNIALTLVVAALAIWLLNRKRIGPA